MVNFLLDPIVAATTPPTFYDFPPPALWGGLSALDIAPPLGLFPEPIGIGRSFYGSLFLPYNFSSPMGRWGDEWYEHDLLDAGARLAYWGNAITETDPWTFPYYWDFLMRQNYYPPAYFSYPISTPPLFQLSPVGNQNTVKTSA